MGGMSGRELFVTAFLGPSVARSSHPAESRVNTTVTTA
jgi:hypothetical protein